jgi:hypothetical protein
MNLPLLKRIERFLQRSRMAPTRFGREAVRDPRLVFDMRMGREPRRMVAARITRFLDKHERSLEVRRCRPRR